METPPPLLQVRNLHTKFHTEAGVVEAVNGVDFTLAQQQILGLVGESGCGKTVTGLSILRLIPQPPGRIEQGHIVFEDTGKCCAFTAKHRNIRPTDWPLKYFNESDCPIRIDASMNTRIR